MAQQVVIPGMHATAKLREPVAVWLLNYPTLGIYTYFWWYYINDEMRHLGVSRGRRDLGTNPGLSLIAILFGWILIIPPAWTLVTTMRRLQRSQEAVGVDRMNGWISAVLWLFTFGIGGYIYTQSNLNRVWRALQYGDHSSPLPGVAETQATAQAPRFDAATGRPIVGYDPQTGEPVLGERTHEEPPPEPDDEPPPDQPE